MKKIKLLAIGLLFCGAILTGYTAYQNAYASPEQQLLHANLEALSIPESTAGKTGCAGLQNSCIPQVGSTRKGPEFTYPK